MAAKKRKSGLIARKTSRPPQGFRLSGSIRRRLKPAEREGAEAHLWTKSAGICALCDGPLPLDGKKIDVDHYQPVHRGSGGSDRLANLYLAHSTCNRSRQNLPFDLAHPIIRFCVWCEERKDEGVHVQFSDFIKEFIDGGGKPVRFSRSGGNVTVTCGARRIVAPLAEDPATKTEYFFAEIPPEFILNDSESQPRRLESDHVRTLAIDFHIHPVHEPSNCRLVRNGDTARLLQFDGQHKTAAQCLLGRKTIQTKVYIEPDIAMIQELVLQIQQGIKKRPLSASDTLRKLDQVLKDVLQKYKPAKNTVRSEQGLIVSQPLEKQKVLKKKLLENLTGLVLFDEDNRMRDFVSRGKSAVAPISDKVFVNRLVRPMICQSLLTSDIDSPDYERDTERENVLLVVNKLADQMLVGKWKKVGSTLERKRAQNFFYQGSIGWWLNLVLIPAMRNVLLIPEQDKDRLFLKPLKPREKRERLLKLVEELCSWDIWSTDDPEAVKAMRSNTAQNVAQVFSNYRGKEYNEFTLARKVMR